MFDEKKDIWITIYKYLVIAIFCACIIFGIIAGVSDSNAGRYDVGIGGDDDGFCDFIVWVLIGGVVGFAHLFVNMVVIQFLNNVQIIRKKIEAE